MILSIPKPYGALQSYGFLLEGEVLHGKIIVLTLNEQEEKVIDKIISAISDCIQLEAVQTAIVPDMTVKLSFGVRGHLLFQFEPEYDRIIKKAAKLYVYYKSLRD